MLASEAGRVLRSLQPPRVRTPAGLSLLEFEDLRKRIWLLENIGAGTYPQRSGAEDSLEYYWIDDYTPGTGNDVLYHAGDLKVVWKKEYWTNWVDITNSQAKNLRPEPPANIHPQPEKWVLSNSFWRLCPDRNYYHHRECYFNSRD